MERNRTRDIILSLIIALALWFYAINQANPVQTDTFRQIPVVVTGGEALAERGLAVAGNQEYKVDVKVSGRRNDFKTGSKEDFSATADIAALSHGDAVLNVSITPPKGLTVDEIISEEINVKVEEYVTELKPVRLFPGTAPDGFETTVVKLGLENVSVSGAKSDVASVSYVKTSIPPEMLETGVLSAVNVPCTACDASGTVLTSVSCVQKEVTYEAAVFATKQVQLNTEVVGVSLYGPEGIEKINRPTAVTIKGSDEALAEISAVSTNVINVNGLSSNTTVKLEVELPDGVYLSKSTGTLEAEIIISKEAKAAYEAAQQEGEFQGE